mmetsp:Transcript_95025/g.271717  ORF Transcript_95025/g.271717 Transcript_95025/m.271717 type:complete len:213 (-) Transcript_95025:189-827(-)
MTGSRWWIRSSGTVTTFRSATRSWRRRRTIWRSDWNRWAPVAACAIRRPDEGTLRLARCHDYPAPSAACRVPPRARPNLQRTWSDAWPVTPLCPGPFRASSSGSWDEPMSPQRSPHTPSGSSNGRRVSTPNTNRLREELKQARVALDLERSVLMSERREAQRMWQELDARRDRERRTAQMGRGLISMVSQLTNWTVFPRPHSRSITTAVMNV